MTHTNKSSAAKDQHFLPRFYLKNFLAGGSGQRDPSLWVYEIQKGRWRRRAPKNLAHLRHYYSYEESTGRLVNSVDQSLTAVEGLAARLIRKLLGRQELEEVEQLHFGLFVAQLVLRTPRNEQRVKQSIALLGDVMNERMVEVYRADPDLFERDRKRYEEARGRRLTIGVEDLARRPPQFVMNKPGVLGEMFQPLKLLLGRILEMTWEFQFCRSGDLVINDDPCELRFPEDTQCFDGFRTQGLRLRVPLAKNLVFTATDGDGTRSWGELSLDEVLTLNQRMVRRSNTLIISPAEGFAGDEALDELVRDDLPRAAGLERPVRFHPSLRMGLTELAKQTPWETPTPSKSRDNES